MEFPVALHYIPTNPLDYSIQIKKALSISKGDISLEELEKRIGKEKNYLKHLLEINTSFAERIKKCQEENNIDIEETCKVCRITKEQYDKYMELLNDYYI